jgi:hypothetical protein
MAEMASNSEQPIDVELYEKLTPALANVGSFGKTICISNPLGPYGKFYELYEESHNKARSIYIQLPTSKVNPHIEKEFLRRKQEDNPTTYEMYFNAKFGVSGSEPWLPKDVVYQAFNYRLNTPRLERGHAGTHYFMHVDPAVNSNNYTLAIVHTEPSGTVDEKKIPLLKVVVDHIHIFYPPGNGVPIDPEVVDSYILNLTPKFHLSLVTYDHYFGNQNSIIKMNSFGLNVKMTPFSGAYQDLIFSELSSLFISGRIEFYDLNTTYYDKRKEEICYLKEVDEAKTEFVSIQRKYRKNKYKIEALSNMNDDIVDCVAGASYQALKYKQVGRMPTTRTMYTGYALR